MISKRRIYVVIFLVLIAPLLFININERHDWGGDFAQYLSQTKKLIARESSDLPPIVDSQHFCPTQRGAGFSLLLAPVYYFFGNNIRAFILFISLSLFLTGILLYLFFRRSDSPSPAQPTAFLLVLIILYNYHVLDFKMEIIPVFPFMIALYSCLLLYKKHSLSAFLTLCILSGLMITINNAGWTFYLAVLMHLVINITTKDRSGDTKRLFLFFCLPLFTYALVNYIVFGNLSTESVTWYKDFFLLTGIQVTVFENLKHYLNFLKIFFEQEIWWWANILIKDSILALLFIGIIARYRNRMDLADTFFVFYILLLLCYPYHTAGLRFLVPVIPVILLYVFLGLNFLESKFPIKKTLLINIFLLGILASNYINFRQVIERGEKEITGPQDKDAMEAFQAVRNKTSRESIVAFAQPWVLHFYTGRTSMLLNSGPGSANKISEFKVGNILLCTDSNQSEIFDRNLVQEIIDSRYKIIWRNQSFVLVQV